MVRKLIGATGGRVPEKAIRLGISIVLAEDLFSQPGKDIRVWLVRERAGMDALAKAFEGAVMKREDQMAQIRGRCVWECHPVLIGFAARPVAVVHIEDSISL